MYKLLDGAPIYEQGKCFAVYIHEEMLWRAGFYVGSAYTINYDVIFTNSMDALEYAVKYYDK